MLRIVLFLILLFDPISTGSSILNLYHKPNPRLLTKHGLVGSDREDQNGRIPMPTSATSWRHRTDIVPRLLWRRACGFEALDNVWDAARAENGSTDHRNSGPPNSDVTPPGLWSVDLSAWDVCKTP